MQNVSDEERVFKCSVCPPAFHAQAPECAQLQYKNPEKQNVSKSSCFWPGPLIVFRYSEIFSETETEK